MVQTSFDSIPCFGEVLPYTSLSHPPQIPFGDKERLKIFSPDNFCRITISIECYLIFKDLICFLFAEEDLNEVLASVLKSVDDVMLSQSVKVNQRENMMMMMVWVCKSLVLRWHEKTSDLLTKLVSLLHNEIVSKFIGDKFFILMKEYDDCLNAKMHAKMKIMHKQRLVEFILPHLVKEYKSSNDVVKCNFLKAISHLLRQLPKQILQKQISPVSV